MKLLVSIGITRGEIYNLMDVWERYSQLLSELEVEVTKNTFQSQITEIVAQLDQKQPQLLFPAVSARIVVHALKETTDKLDEKMSEDGGGAAVAWPKYAEG